LQDTHTRSRLMAILILLPLLTSLIPATTVAALDNRINVSLGPSNLIADGETHECVFVQITNAKGEPIPAPENVVVTLTSSRLGVGSVQGTVTIKEGSSFTNGTFTTTKYPGTTLITATAPGYMTGGAEMMTYAAATDSHLRVYPLPSIAPAVNGTKGKVAIEILNENDSPYASPEDVAITLATNSTILTMDKNAIISAGSYYVLVEYTISGNFTIPKDSNMTTYDQNVTLSAIAQGFKPGEASVQVKTPGNETSTLLLELGPSTLLPKDYLPDSAVVTILDKDSHPVCINGTLLVSLSSSADKTVSKVEKSVTIENTTSFAYVDLSSLGTGTSLIAASAQGATLGSAEVTVVGSTPSALVVYTTPHNILTGDPSTPTATILVVDQNGVPITVEDDVNVFLSSSNPDVGTLAQFVIIHAGNYYAQVAIEPEAEAGSISIAASAKNFEPSENTLKTTSLMMNATLTATRPTAVNDTIIITIVADRFGEPVQGVTVKLSVLGGAIETFNETTNSEGVSTAAIKQTSTTMKITAHLSKPSYNEIDLTKISTVPTQQSTELSVNIFGLTIPLFYIIVGIGVAVIVVFAMYIVIKYRRKSSDKLEVVG